MNTSVKVLFIFSMTAALPVAGATQADFDQKLTAAQQARDKADAVGGVWRDVDKLLKDAQAAATAGDYDKAMSLATTAQSQSELGYQQAVEQKDSYRIPPQLQ